MASNRIYLDHNASAPLLGAAREAILAALENSANPSSVHEEGRAVRRTIEEARRAVAALVGGMAEHVVFTSGATEAASMLLTPDWRMGRATLRIGRLFVSATDHPCTHGGGRFPTGMVTELPVGSDGVLDVDVLEAALAVHDRADGVPMLAMHAANNETGVVQPFDRIGRAARAAGAIVVFDAVQAAGRIPLDISAGYADFLILTAHKIGGPKGAGAIVAAGELAMPAPMVTGGGQERGHRGGTENAPGIAGFGAAAKAALAGRDDFARIAGLRDAFEARLLSAAPGAVIHGGSAARLANTSFFTLPGVRAETAQIAFDLAGVALSAGSACSSGKVGPSRVLKAMGVADDLGALRVSMGPSTTQEDIERFFVALEGLMARRAGMAVAAE